MDVVHHAAIGGIGLAALASRNQELAGIAFLSASVLPDLDVAFMAGGKRAYLKNHQGPTHSLLLSPVLAGLIAFPLVEFLAADVVVFVTALAGLWLHIALDLSNTFGIALLWPLSTKRFCFDAVFFVDLTLWAMTLSAGAASYFLEATWTPWIYALAFGSYVVLKGCLQSRVRRRLGCELAIPSSWHPFHFFILERREGVDHTYLYNALGGKSTGERAYARVSKDFERLASESVLYRDMKAITRHFAITNVEETDGAVTIWAADIGILNFGGKFGRTTLTFDRSGELVHEVADI